MKIREMYRLMKGNVSDINALFEVLDCLYALGIIDINGDNLLIIEKEDNE